MTVQEQLDRLVRFLCADPERCTDVHMAECVWYGGDGETMLDALIAAVRAEEAERLRALEAALRAIVFCDLRDDFQDGDDIVLRWEGNKADWQSARALLAGEEGR